MFLATGKGSSIPRDERIEVVRNGEIHVDGFCKSDTCPIQKAYGSLDRQVLHKGSFVTSHGLLVHYKA